MRQFDFFAQDSWRAKVEPDAEPWPALRAPAPAVSHQQQLSTATVADVWGVSGVDNLFKPGVLNGKKPEFVQYPARPARLQHGLEQPRSRTWV